MSGSDKQTFELIVNKSLLTTQSRKADPESQLAPDRLVFDFDVVREQQRFAQDHGQDYQPGIEHLNPILARHIDSVGELQRYLFANVSPEAAIKVSVAN